MISVIKINAHYNTIVVTLQYNYLVLINGDTGI